MALARWQATIVDETGNVVDQVTVRVEREVLGFPLATLFADRDGAVPLSNPFTLASGETLAAFHCVGGAYRITATKGLFQRTLRYVPVGLAAETDGSLASSINLPEGVNPAVPPVGNLTLYATADHEFALKDSAGNVSLINGDPSVCQCRLSLVSGTPVVATSQTAKTSIKLVPYKGNRLALWNGWGWSVAAFSEISASIASLAANTIYDVFVYANAGVLTLEFVAWTTNSLRATALAYQNGIPVKSGAPTRRYLGTIVTTATAGQCEFSFGGAAIGGSPAFLGVWNYYNRVRVAATVGESRDSWAGVAGTRVMAGSLGNKVSFVSGLEEDFFEAVVVGSGASGTAGNFTVGVGVDVTTTISGLAHGGNTAAVAPCSGRHASTYLGGHINYALEYMQTSGVTWIGDNGLSPAMQSGITFTGMM